ncbi:MAG: glycosyltransferase involved in cell wall biosynthesis [Saprospiraceae bacterium]|jgi:glycosyltransferase involved in cell wall biosynthesis
MRDSTNKPRIIDVIIPAYNEEQSIGKVLDDIPKDLVRHMIVGNNGSTDNTKEIALSSGAIVEDEPKSGYGNACLAGMKYISTLEVKPDIVVFLDGDYSDFPEQMRDVVRPIIKDAYDLVIGSRVKGDLQKGSMTPPQIFGNWLATNLIRIFYKYEFSDLGPFRAIRYDKLLQLEMSDPDFGWTVEMQVKAAKQEMRCIEVAIDYRKRIGKSKVSGTIKGTILAGHKILWTIFKLI